MAIKIHKHFAPYMSYDCGRKGCTYSGPYRLSRAKAVEDGKYHTSVVHTRKKK